MIEIHETNTTNINEAEEEQKKQKRPWINPMTAQRSKEGQFYRLYADMRMNPSQFFSYYRMSIQTFDELLSYICPHITFKDTKWRKSIGPEERLSVTLRYLATGTSFRSLYLEFLLGESTIRRIVQHTCKVISKHLKTICFPINTSDMWLQNVDNFYSRTKFPNCLGAINQKHIPIKKSNKIGSEYFNSKKYCSMILLAIVDADYCFIYVDTGPLEADVFENSTFYKKLDSASLNIPGDRCLPGDNAGTPMPFVFLGGDAFRVTNHMQRPYGKQKMTVERKVYNHHIAKARRIAERAFAILTNKWKIFQQPLSVNTEFCDNIVRACCTLHNFVRRRDGIAYKDTLYDCPLPNVSSDNVRGEPSGYQNRDYFVNYFSLQER